MNKMAKVRRRTADGEVHIAAVNVAKVLYVFQQEPSVSQEPPGSYIVFRDGHDHETRKVTPIGMDSPDSVKRVIRRLNTPYWFDLGLRIGSLFAATVAVVLAIIYGPG